MTKSIEIRPSIGTIANSVAFDAADELSSELKSYQKEGVEILFRRAETALFTGDPAETLLIAISGGVATHIISRVIDKVLSVIRERKAKANTVGKSDVVSKEPSVQDMKLFSHSNEKLSSSFELHQLTKLRLVVRDADNNVDFDVTEDQTICIKHFNKAQLNHDDEKA